LKLPYYEARGSLRHGLQVHGDELKVLVAPIALVNVMGTFDMVLPFDGMAVEDDWNALPCRIELVRDEPQF
jgi:hypothetical protein